MAVFWVAAWCNLVQVTLTFCMGLSCKFSWIESWPCIRLRSEVTSHLPRNDFVVAYTKHVDNASRLLVEAPIVCLQIFVFFLSHLLANSVSLLWNKPYVSFNSSITTVSSRTCIWQTAVNLRAEHRLKFCHGNGALMFWNRNLFPSPRGVAASWNVVIFIIASVMNRRNSEFTCGNSEGRQAAVRNENKRQNSRKKNAGTENAVICVIKKRESMTARRKQF